MTYLLSVSIGPVQDFIAAARKTRDLWFGSSMLSEISRSVAEELPNLATKVDLIFPPSVGNKNASVANKILAQVDTDNPKALSEKLRNVAMQRIRDYRQKAVDAISAEHEFPALVSDSTRINWDLVDKQIEGFLEFYAAWWPLNGDYADARAQVERLIAGRKALRDFAPAVGKEGVPKSSLDGGRESVIDFGTLSDAEVRHLRRKGIRVNDPPQSGRNRTGEYLDGISLIKRTASTQRFVSVARVAIDPLIRRMVAEGMTKQLTSLRQFAEALKDTDLVSRFDAGEFPQYKDFPYDTQLFYAQSVDDTDIRDAGLEGEEPAKAKSFIDSVAEVKKRLGISEIQPYVAVLAGDGDRMGTLISALKDKDRHKELSAKLAEFASEAKKIVEDNYGALVYSGGDDVLAFLPLDTALACAQQLHDSFKKLVGNPFANSGVTATFSCGVSIAHYSEHLRNQVQWARDAETAAKKNEQDSRDSLAVHLHTRTAGDEFVGSVHKWGDKPEDSPVEKRWNKWLGLYQRNELPTSAAYDLRRLHREMEVIPQEVRQKVLDKEIGRILSRKEKDGVRIDPQLAADVSASAAGGVEQLGKLVSELIIARHFYRAVDLAGKGTKQDG